MAAELDVHNDKMVAVTGVEAWAGHCLVFVSVFLTEKDAKRGITATSCRQQIKAWKRELLLKPNTLHLGRMKVLRFMDQREASERRSKLVGLRTQDPKYGGA